MDLFDKLNNHFHSLFQVPESLLKGVRIQKQLTQIQTFKAQLDTNIKFVGGFEQNSRVEFEKMRRYSGSILVDQKDKNRGYNTTCTCGVKRLNADVENVPVNVVLGAESEKIFYNGLMKCGSVWRCPVCGFKIMKHRQNELYYMSSEWLRLAKEQTEESQKNKISFITLTMRHRASFGLRKSLDILLSEFRKFQMTKTYRKLEKEHNIFGFVKTLEMTYGEENGWHPHLHILLFHKSHDFKDLHANFIAGWCKRKNVDALQFLQKAKLVFNSKGVSEYVSKFDMFKDIPQGGGKEGKKNDKKKSKKMAGYRMDLPAFVFEQSIESKEYKDHYGSKWSITKEMTHSNLKQAGKGNHTENQRYTPFSILRGLALNEFDDYNHGRFHFRYLEYCQATKGRHFIVVSKKLKKFFKEASGVEMKSDEEILQDEQIDEVLFKIEPDLWDHFTKEKEAFPGHILNAFENGGISYVLNLFSELGYNVAFDMSSRLLYSVSKSVGYRVPENTLVYVLDASNEWRIRRFKCFLENGKIEVYRDQEGGLSGRSVVERYWTYSFEVPLS